VAENVADILVVVDQGAAVDEEISAVAAQLDEQRTVIATWIVENLTRRAALQPGLTERTAIDTVWLLLDPVVFRRLTRDPHWSTDDFQTWCTTSLRLVLLAPQKSPRSSGAG
jgi:hypothetical protein